VEFALTWADCQMGAFDYIGTQRGAGCAHDLEFAAVLLEPKAILNGSISPM
jgi:hypothetical protein